MARGQGQTAGEALAVQSHTMCPPGNALNVERRNKSLLVIDPISHLHRQIFDVPGVWLHYEIRENTHTAGPWTRPHSQGDPLCSGGEDRHLPEPEIPFEQEPAPRAHAMWVRNQAIRNASSMRAAVAEIPLNGTDICASDQFLMRKVGGNNLFCPIGPVNSTGANHYLPPGEPTSCVGN